MQSGWFLNAAVLKAVKTEMVFHSWLWGAFELKLSSEKSEEHVKQTQRIKRQQIYAQSISDCIHRNGALAKKEKAGHV